MTKEEQKIIEKWAKKYQPRVIRAALRDAGMRKLLAAVKGEGDC